MDYIPIPVGFTIYENDIVIHYDGSHHERCPGERGIIGDMSAESYKMFCFLCNNIVYDFQYMYTFTFPAYTPLFPVTKKKLLNKILSRLRYGGMKHYIWVMEFQERGALHFHIVCDVNVSRETLLVFWAGAVFQDVSENKNEYIWIDGIKGENIQYSSISSEHDLLFEYSKHIREGVQIEIKEKDFRHYLMKHARKLKQKELPAYLVGSGLGRWFGWSRKIWDLVVPISSPESILDFPEIRELLKAEVCYSIIHSTKSLKKGKKYETLTNPINQEIRRIYEKSRLKDGNSQNNPSSENGGRRYVLRKDLQNN